MVHEPSEAIQHLEYVVEEIHHNPDPDRAKNLETFMEAAIGVWNEDIAGDIELADGTTVTIQEIHFNQE